MNDEDFDDIEKQ